jgi:hypothetical protein
MTQFVLCYADRPLKIKPPFSKISIEDDSFLSGVALDVFPDIDKKSIFTVALDGSSFDSICTTTQIDLAEGKMFSETSLFVCIGWLLDTCTGLVFWYGRDYDDLDCVYGRDELIEKTEGAIIDSNCELYVRYERNKKKIRDKP